MTNVLILVERLIGVAVRLLAGLQRDLGSITADAAPVFSTTFTPV